MRRPLWFRAILAAWALWFTATVADSGRLHACAAHDTAASHVGSGHSAKAVAGHEGHDMGGQDQNRESCTCLGACCAVSPVALRVPTHDIAVLTLISVPAAAFGDIVTSRLDREHVLPFANGPPALA